jgi:FO synthase
MNDLSRNSSEDRNVVAFLERAPLASIMVAALECKSRGSGAIISYSRKVFIPLTRLCRDFCSYCTFAHAPRRGTPAFLSAEEVLDIARAGKMAGCKEALFTLGDKPELRYEVAREALQRLGHRTTVSYLTEICGLVLRETGLLPHVNAGVMREQEMAGLRSVSASQGLMLETSSPRLAERSMPHFGSPDKRPDVRLAMLEAAGRAEIPFTTGILIGIGETRRERLESLLAIRELHQRHSHIQEVIIQNFRSKPSTRMAGAAEPSLHDLLWTIAAARLLLGPGANIQAPPNLSGDSFPELLGAGINDWGGISPLTIDHVNPEASWPDIAVLTDATQKAGFELVERLAAYPEYVRHSGRWFGSDMATAVVRMSDASGYARTDDWAPGRADIRPPVLPGAARGSGRLDRILGRAAAGYTLQHDEIVRLLAERGSEVSDICVAADEVRHAQNGEVLTYVVNRNINYTNVCSYRCGFCAFSKGRAHEALRGAAYDLTADEITRRVREAWDRGATEVCMQGGIHPHYTGNTYLDLLRIAKNAVPDMHIHAFSPLEVWHGASTLGVSVESYLGRLKDNGLGTLPGTAAEILDDRIRDILCPDKIRTAQWLSTVEAAHRVGLRTTATIMFGHVDDLDSWATHLLSIRALQERTGGFTEFVPLPFVHMEAPLYYRGRARCGPTWRETVLMHAVARLTLNPVIPNIQASWVKLGADGLRVCIDAGVNDLGGTLMNESISRAAGTQHGQEFAPADIEAFIRSTGRKPLQRTTLYRSVSDERFDAALTAEPLKPVVLNPAGKRPQIPALTESEL